MKIDMLKKVVSACMSSPMSYDDLCENFQISRHDIYEIVKYLDGRGCEWLQTETSLQLKHPIEWLDADLLQSNITSKLHYFPEIDSTNSFLVEHRASLQSGDICLAEYQNKARARRSKDWIAPYGSHLSFSMYWSFEATQTISGLSLAVGLALLETLQSFEVDNLGVKWPNDIYRDGKKLAGILIECSTGAFGKIDVVIGMGINLYDFSSREGITQPVATLTDLMSQQVSKTELTQLLWQNLSRALQKFERYGFVYFQNKWLESDIFMNKKVEVIKTKSKTLALHRGADSDGNLLLEIDGVMIRHASSDISLRLAVD